MNRQMLGACVEAEDAAERIELSAEVSRFWTGK